MRRALILASLLLAVGWALAQTSSGDLATDELIPLGNEVKASAEDLDALRAQIKTTRSELDSITTREADAEKALTQVAREEQLLQELVGGLDQREQLLAAQRDSLQVRVAQHTENYEQRKAVLAQRLRALAMRGPQQDLDLILTSQSFSTLVARLRFTAMVARLDGTLVDRTRQQRETIAAEQRELQVALVGIWESREEATGQRERLTVLQAERRGLVRELKKQKRQTARALQDLQRREKKLLDVLAQLEERRKATPPTPSGGGDAGAVTAGRLAGRQGDLDWPVSGEIVQKFGRHVHPQFKTVTVSNGIGIAAGEGSPVYAVAPGTVEFAERLPGFGLCVILDHGAGQYTLYANLARVFVSKGRDVSQGQVLAELGSGTGGDKPQLYFEIRQGRDPLDPMTWLKAAP